MMPTQTPKLKVCGITNVFDAQHALEAGADWLGLIAVPNTPRFIDVFSARALVEELRESYPSAYVVGVFQNATPEEISTYAKAVKLNALQLHGQENPGDYAHLGLPIIKVLPLNPQSTLADLQTQTAFYLQQPQVLTCLLDLPKGSGLKSILDWPEFARLQELTADIPLMIAGGLNPDNIETILNALTPWGIDVASGVESKPGRKDLQKLSTFCQTVKQWNAEKLQHRSPMNGEQESCNP